MCDIGDVERNKRIVLDCVMALRDGHMALFHSMMADDAEIWVPEGTRFSVTYTPSSYVTQLGATLFPLIDGKQKTEIHTITAEEDRVCLEAETYLKFKDGRVYNNRYHFLFRVQDGLIVSMKEYLNTQHITDVFGPIE